MVHNRLYKTCYDIWQRIKNVYSNDIQHLYDVIHNLANLQITEDIMPYANQAQTGLNEFQLLVNSEDSKKMIEKLDNVCMIYVLHKNYESVSSHSLIAPEITSTENLISHMIYVLHKNYESVCNQIITASEIPSKENLTNHLLRMSSP